MKVWNCSFCGKHEDEGMVYTTCIVPGVSYIFCTSCWKQWKGFQEMTCVNLIKLRDRVKNLFER